MSDQSGSSPFQAVFESALQDYEKQTGISLANHPLAGQLQNCQSVESVTTLLQEEAQSFSKFRESGKIFKSLKGTIVSTLSRVSAIAALGRAIGVSFPPANAIHTGLGILLMAFKGVSTDLDALVDLLESMEQFLKRLDIYTKVPPTPALTEIVVKIIVELLSTLALATKQIRQGRPKKFVKKLFGENEVDAILQRLDRLTQDEARTTAAQTLEVVYGLIQNMRVVMDDGKASANSIRDALEIIQELTSEMNKLKRDKSQQDIRSWLSPPDPWKNHNLARGSRHAGTAAWFVGGSTLSKWKSSGPSSLLWIHGKPGAGKSVLWYLHDHRGYQLDEEIRACISSFLLLRL
ncbi:hypothetical protein BJV77DRAFT_566061 [Russula vinacea]|nr:hypothetical protein BJV77DRAFT_566061 [Russula vinacea]